MSGAVAGAGAAAPRPAKVGPLKVCVFASSVDGYSAPTENVRVAAANGAGVGGAVILSSPVSQAGAGLDKTIPFRLGKGGTFLTTFAVARTGTIRITVKLATTPPRRRTLTLNLAAMSEATAAGCIPR